MPKPTGTKHYVGPLDLVRGAPLVAISQSWALSKVTRGQPLIRVQRTLDGAIDSFNSDQFTGQIDRAAVDAFIGTRVLKRTAVSSPPLSDTITLDDASGVNKGMAVSGPGIGYGAVVLDVSAAPTIKLTQRPGLSAATELTFTDVGGIETAFDQSGKGNHEVQTDIVQQPLWASDFANKGGMSTNTKFSPQERGGFLATVNPITIPNGKFSLFTAIAFEDTGYGSLTPIMGIDGLSNVFAIYLAANWVGHSSMDNFMYDGTNYGEWESGEFGKVAYETPLLVNLLFDSQGTSRVVFDGVEYSYAGSNKVMGPISGRLAIGSQDASLFSNSFKGDIGTTILYPDVVSPQDAVSVRKSMADFHSS